MANRLLPLTLVLELQRVVCGELEVLERLLPSRLPRINDARCEERV